MRKDEFLRKLEYLLQDIPEADREEAMDYYRDYLEEAGHEKEEEVLREFGSPERIAAIIRSDSYGNLEEGGSYTESGYEDERFREPNYQLVKREDITENREKAADADKSNGNKEMDSESGWKKHDNYASENTEEKRKSFASDPLKVVLCIILLVAVAPVLFGLGGSAVSVIVGIVVTAASLLFLAAILTIAFLIVGVLLVGAGIATVWTDPVDGVLALGGGLLLFGLGLLALVFSLWFYRKVVPRVFRWIGNGLDTVSDWVRRRGR